MPPQQQAAAGDRAAAREYVTVSSYAEAEEVLRRAQDFAISGHKPGAVPYLEDHVATIDGRRHLERRRLYRDLFKAQRLAGYDTLFAAALDTTLAHYRGQAPEGSEVRFDLIECLRRAYGQVVVDLIGFDLDQASREGEAFQRDVHAIVEAVASDFSRGDLSDVHDRAGRAKQHIREAVFEPSRQRRLDLLAEARREGRDPADVLPGDVLSFLLLAREAAPEGGGLDEEAMLRECLGFLVGGANNPSASAAWSLAELEGWIEGHPGDRHALADRAFLEAVVKESLRLHRTGAPFLIRRALGDVQLRSSGRTIEAGQWVAIAIPEANRDPAVFGDDAARFDPRRRRLDGRERPYGLAFATGPHVCIARPMMVDDDEATERYGLQVEVLRTLLEAGVRMDPERPPIRAEHGGERFAEFPVRIGEPLVVHPDGDAPLPDGDDG